MNLNHMDLQVSDVPAARRFFEEHFGLRCVYERQGLAMLQGGDEFELAVSNLFDSPPPQYPPDFHIGFVLSTPEEVRDAYERVRTAGVSIRTEVSETGPNIYFVCTGPDSIPVEVRAPRRE